MADNPRKYANKYDSPDELEKGYMNLVPEFDRVKSEARVAAERAAAAEERARLAEAQAQAATRVFQDFQESMKQKDDPRFIRDGEFDDRALQQYIDAKLMGVEKKLSSVGEIVDEKLRAILTPFSRAQEGKMVYAQDNPEFDDPTIQRFLSSNPGINRTFQRLVSTATTKEEAAEAYAYAHGAFRATMPKTSAVDEGRKRDAGAPQPAAGPSLAGQGDGAASAEQLRALAVRAQNTYAPEDELALAREFFKGSKVLQEIDSMKPDWAKE